MFCSRSLEKRLSAGLEAAREGDCTRLMLSIGTFFFAALVIKPPTQHHNPLVLTSFRSSRLRRASHMGFRPVHSTRCSDR